MKTKSHWVFQSISLTQATRKEVCYKSSQVKKQAHSIVTQYNAVTFSQDVVMGEGTGCVVSKVVLSPWFKNNCIESVERPRVGVWSRVPVRLKTNGDKRVHKMRSPLRAWKSRGPTNSNAASVPTSGHGNDWDDGSDILDSPKSRSIKQLGTAINKHNYTIPLYDSKGIFLNHLPIQSIYTFHTYAIPEWCNALM